MSIGHSVRFYSTPFVILTDAFSGKFLCVSDLGEYQEESSYKFDLNASAIFLAGLPNKANILSTLPVDFT